MAEANKEQAERCAELGIRAMREGKLEESLRFFDKSLRMYDSGAVRSLREKVIKAQQGSGDGSDDNRSGAGTPATPSSSRRQENSGGNSEADTSSARSAGGAGGVRHRQPSSRAASPAAVQRPYTVEQVEMVQRVIRATDYYEVLMVERSIDGDGVKKAYKKLAVKMHPDKNPAPGAEDAFKRIGAAFSILSDADKRAHYDRFGSEDTNSGSGGQAASSQRAYYRQYEQEISPEDIFNMFFGFQGGSPFGGGGVVYTSDGRTYRTGGRPQRQHRQTADNSQENVAGHRVMQFMQLMPILLLIVFTLMSFGGNTQEERLYSLYEENAFKVERRTTMPTVVADLPYFVKDDFFKRIGGDRYTLLRIERAVETELYNSLQRKCTEESQKRRVVENKVRAAAPGAQRDKLEATLRAFQSPACDAFKKYFSGQ